MESLHDFIFKKDNEEKVSTINFPTYHAPNRFVSYGRLV